jgi:hypothetical protein
MNPPLPKQLHYMKPFLRYLESLPPDEWNEDVDATLLEKALRKRLSKGDPEETLDSDRQLLEDWLAGFDSPSHPAHWIVGFLHGVMVSDLLEDNQSHPGDVPRIAVQPPPGWTVSNNGSELRKGELVAVIIPLDQFTYDLQRRQMDASHQKLPPVVEHRTASPVAYGESTGYKYLYEQSAPFPWKQINYLLAVRGGFVSINVCAMGAAFDEQDLEASLHTVSIAPQTA